MPVARTASALALFVAVALVQTTPLALYLTTSIPFGNDVSSTVPRLNLWALWWNADRLLHLDRGYWDAPMFYPEAHAFAYTETEWLTGLVASPLWWLSGRPALTYDVVVLAALVLTGLGGYLLLRTLGLGFLPALGGGMVTEMLPTVADQLGVLQSATVLFPMLMCLACVVRFGRTGRVQSAIGIGAWFAACFHTSSNMTLFFAPALGLGVLVVAGRQLVRARPAAALVAGGVLAAALVAPVAVVQMRTLATKPPHGDAEIAGSSAHLGTYAQMAPTNLLRRRPPDRREATLGLGLALPALAALGAWYGLRRRRLRLWTIYSLLAVLACTLLSFGPLLASGTLGSLLDGPYRLLTAYYPGFRFARNLWRFGAVAQLFVAALAGAGLAACFGERHTSRGVALGTVATLAVAIDLLATPIPLLDLHDECRHVDWVEWLAASPPDTTLVHIPMPTDVTAEAYERTAVWMTCEIAHGRRIANGYAAFIPSRTALLLQVMPGFPDVDSLRALQYFGIDHVVADADWLTPDHTSRTEEWRKWVVPELVSNDAAIYRIVGASPQARPAGD